VVSKCNIALLTSTLSEAAGGLSYSVPSLAFGLDDSESISAHVIGVTDVKSPLAYSAWGNSVYTHKPFGPKVLNYAPGMLRTLTNLNPDIVDVNGLWSYSSLVNLMYHYRSNTPYVVTPRGMLDPWALEQSRGKKLIAQIIYENQHLTKASVIRATADMEAEHFREYGLRQPIAVIPNGIHTPQLLKQSKRSKTQKKRLLFLSRIHPKKGLNYLIERWQSLENVFPDWELVVAGIDEDGYITKMRALADSLGLSNIIWQGAVFGDEKSELYRSANLFVLPTHAENFGLVVAEALAHGVPVVTTQNAPWSGLIEHDCGWWIKLNELELENCLTSAMSLSVTDLSMMGRRGHAWMEREFSHSSVITKMQDLYKWISLGGDKPGFVYND